MEAQNEPSNCYPSSVKYLRRSLFLSVASVGPHCYHYISGRRTLRLRCLSLKFPQCRFRVHCSFSCLFSEGYFLGSRYDEGWIFPPSAVYTKSPGSDCCSEPRCCSTCCSCFQFEQLVPEFCFHIASFLLHTVPGWKSWSTFPVRACGSDLSACLTVFPVPLGLLSCLPCQSWTLPDIFVGFEELNLSDFWSLPSSFPLQFDAEQKNCLTDLSGLHFQMILSAILVEQPIFLVQAPSQVFSLPTFHVGSIPKVLQESKQRLEHFHSVLTTLFWHRLAILSFWLFRSWSP